MKTSVVLVGMLGALALSGASYVEVAAAGGRAAMVAQDVCTAPGIQVAFERGYAVPGPYRHGDPYYGGRYYYKEHEEGKSPYEDLQIRPAGSLLISVVPAHARVWVDGYEAKPGADNSFELGLLVGTHQVRAHAEGYRPYQGEVVIETGKRTVLSIELKR